MDLRGYRKPLIFGGSFDPPHRAHVELPRLVRRKIDADVIVYVPAGIAPHKQGEEHTPAKHRLAMTRLAVADDPFSLVSSVEVDRDPSRPSYTAETLQCLRGRIDPQAQMRLLIGADQALGFDQWAQPERIVELAQPVVMLRPPNDAAGFFARLSPENQAIWARRVVEVPAMAISATQIRQRLATGQRVTDLIPESVAHYIERHGLYQY